jgi:hypothetical protein
VNATIDQLKAVLNAAEYLLGARQDRMLTLDEWADLARAVAACTGRKTADLFSEGDLADIAERVSFGWDPEIDGPLPDVD